MCMSQTEVNKYKYLANPRATLEQIEQITQPFVVGTQSYDEWMKLRIQLKNICPEFKGGTS